MAIQRAFRAALVLLLLGVSGCVGVSRTSGVRQVHQEITTARGDVPMFVTPGDSAASDARVAELLAAPLTSSAAVQVAFLRNPLVLEAYARLGVSQADVVSASRIANPVISGSIITGAGERQAIGGIAQPITDLLLLSARKRLAAGAYERTQHLVAASLLDLSRDAEGAWYRYVSAEQVSAMRQAVARAADVSATLSQRFFDAGNINELELALDRAGAAQARLAAMRAAADARRAKYDLQQRMGLSGDPTWHALRELPAPLPVDEPLESLVARAHDQRFDLVAARREVTILADALKLAKRWRWLGTVEVGLQRERETDGRVLTGPTLALALPIFNQGQAGIARADAQLNASRARLAALELAEDNAVRLGLERLAAAHQVAEEYRRSLVPERELVVKRQQERENFMLIGQFELLLSKQQQYDAYQGYLEAIRDYWLARVDLARAVGGELPSSAATDPAVGVEAILTPPVDSMEHMNHTHDSPPANPKKPAAAKDVADDMSGMPGMSPPQTGSPPHHPTSPRGHQP